MILKKNLPTQVAQGMMIARMCQDLKIQQDRNNNPYATFDVACNRGGEPNYFTLHAFGEIAEQMSAEVNKGDLVQVYTRRSQSMGEDGQPVYATLPPSEGYQHGVRIKTHFEAVESFEVIAKSFQKQNHTESANLTLGDFLSEANSK